MKTVLGCVAALHIALLAGCGEPASPDDETSTLDKQEDSIVNGRACDSWVRAAIVGVGLDSGELPLELQSRCSGTLIAPNLVLTARHCVAPLLGSGAERECDSDGSANPAVRFGTASAEHIFIFDDLTGPALAAASRVFVPAQAPLCNNDIALLVLDRRLPSKKPAPIRAFSSTGKPLSTSAARVNKNNDSRVTVAGFGLLDYGVENYKGCQQRSVKVLADPAHPAYFLGKHEFSTGYGTCNGDSGGPVFDHSGRLVGVTSRGLMSCHGPGVYPDLAFHTGLIAQALAAAAAAD